MIILLWDDQFLTLGTSMSHISKLTLCIVLSLSLTLVCIGEIVGQQPEDLKLVPGNAVAAVHMDLAKLWRSESMKEMRDLLKKAGPKALTELE